MIRRLTLAILIFLALAATASALPWSKKYPLTVVHGAGAGSYKAGEKVAITAWPPLTLQGPEITTETVFSMWTGAGTVADVKNPETTYTMPAHAVTIGASYFTPSR